MINYSRFFLLRDFFIFFVKILILDQREIGRRRFLWDLKGRHFNFDFLLENLVDSFKARGKSCLRTIFTFNSLWGSLERAQKPNSSWFEVQHHPRSSDFAIYSISSTKLLNLKYSLIKNIKSMIKKIQLKRCSGKIHKKHLNFVGLCYI